MLTPPPSPTPWSSISANKNFVMSPRGIRDGTDGAASLDCSSAIFNKVATTWQPYSILCTNNMATRMKFLNSNPGFYIPLYFPSFRIIFHVPFHLILHYRGMIYSLEFLNSSPELCSSFHFIFQDPIDSQI